MLLIQSLQIISQLCTNAIGGIADINDCLDDVA